MKTGPSKLGHEHSAEHKMSLYRFNADLLCHQDPGTDLQKFNFETRSMVVPKAIEFLYFSIEKRNSILCHFYCLFGLNCPKTAYTRQF